jgi:hypothetical protein
VTLPRPETRLIDERFASVMSECEIVTLQVYRLYSKGIRSSVALARILPILDFSWEENTTEVVQGNIKLFPTDHMISWIFVLVQKDSNDKNESFCCTEP